MYLSHRLRNCTSRHRCGYTFTEDAASRGLPARWWGLCSFVALIPPLDGGAHGASAGAKGRATASLGPLLKPRSTRCFFASMRFSACDRK